ncbi:MAG: hypothetical protein ACYTHK_16955 [Planctomycetota bacterium]|jgi:hypothetical protein
MGAVSYSRESEAAVTFGAGLGALWSLLWQYPLHLNSFLEVDLDYARLLAIHSVPLPLCLGGLALRSTALRGVSTGVIGGVLVADMGGILIWVLLA